MPGPTTGRLPRTRTHRTVVRVPGAAHGQRNPTTWRPAVVAASTAALAYAWRRREDLRRTFAARGTSPNGEHEYTACIRVTSETLRFADITARLGPPQRGGHDIAEPLVKDQPERGSWRWTLWYHDSGLPRSANLDEHVAALAQWAEPRQDVLGELRGAGAKVYLWCGIFTAEGSTGRITSLPPELLRRIADLHLSLDIDVY